MSETPKLSEFREAESVVPIEFVETTQVAPGVSCDVYRFAGDTSRDLAIVTVESEHRTPLQRVVGGMHTWEGFLSGEGHLTVLHSDGGASTFKFSGEPQPPIEVKTGEVMQWQATGNEPLVFYEICEPPYEEGRFENLSE